MQQEIKLKLRAFDHRVLDQAVISIIQTVKRIGAKVKGAIPLPRKISRYTVNRSPHIDKESREQFEIRKHSRLLIFEASPQTIDALMKLDLASGVDVEIKLVGGTE
ncbi:MAG: 30S ribosomal protein S10 [Candidatus Midichloria sp.]|nr:30S ribosomal protein S10 [Candidatus Midichloria sp.]